MESQLPSGDEILAMAEGIEEKGMQFYLQMAKKFSNDNEVKGIFEKLADDEFEHKELFRSFRQQHKLNTTIAPDAIQYIKSILKANVFPEEPDEIRTPKEALGIGIEAEKTAILFYNELYEVIENQSDRKIISKLLKEEKMHLVELRDFWDEL